MIKFLKKYKYTSLVAGALIMITILAYGCICPQKESWEKQLGKVNTIQEAIILLQENGQEIFSG